MPALHNNTPPKRKATEKLFFLCISTAPSYCCFCTVLKYCFVKYLCKHCCMYPLPFRHSKYGQQLGNSVCSAISLFSLTAKNRFQRETCPPPSPDQSHSCQTAELSAKHKDKLKDIIIIVLFVRFKR